MTTAEVLVILRTYLPFYESDDKDDYMYIARSKDLEKVAEQIVGFLEVGK